MPSPPSSSPSHHHPFLPNSNAFSASQRTDLQSWMTYHHLPFSALTVSEPPPQAVASSSRDLVVVSAIVGRGMLGSMRVELVVPREEVFRVQRAPIGGDRRSGATSRVVGSWEGGIEVEEKDEGDLWLEDVIARRGESSSPPSSSSTSRQEPWFTRPVRGEHQGGAAATVQFDFTPASSHQPNSSASPPPSSRSTSPPSPPSSHTHRNHGPAHDPLGFTSLPGSNTLRATARSSPTVQARRSILNVRCGHLPPSSPSKRAQRPPPHLYPNPTLHTTSSPNNPPSSSSPSNCANRLVLKLALNPPITTASSPPSPSAYTRPSAQQANFSFLSLPHQHPLSTSSSPAGPRAGKKLARGWIVDASFMEGRVGFLPSSSSDGLSARELGGSDWERVQCGCSSGLRKVGGPGEEEERKRVRSCGCLTCGSPLGIYIPNPCVQHTLKRSPSNASSSSSSSAVWFIPDEFAATSPVSSNGIPALSRGDQMVGR